MRLFCGADFPDARQVGKPAPRIPHKWNSRIANYKWYNTSKNRVDDGYPEPVSKRWVGVTFDRIDASIYWGNGKVYLFSGDQHIRYDMVTYRADVGYPKFIAGSYVEDWKFFE